MIILFKIEENLIKYVLEEDWQLNVKAFIISFLFLFLSFFMNLFIDLFILF
jgi:hypothetical protein